VSKAESVGGVLLLARRARSLLRGWTPTGRHGKVKILLIQQDEGRRKYKTPLFPIGLCYVATALKGHEVRIVDPNQYPSELGLEKVKEVVAAFRPALAGISIRNVDTTQRRDPFVQYKTVRPTVVAVKEIAPSCRVLAGGTGFSIYAEEIMRRIPEIDYGVFLEGEETVVDLLANLDAPERVKGVLFRRAGEVVFTGQRALPSFADMPIPRRDADLLDITVYKSPVHNVVGVQSKRGCPFKCSYCSYPFLNEMKLRMRPAVHVVDEIEQLVKSYGIRGFTFVDSVFNVPEKHARDICDEILRRGLQVEWGAWLTPRGLTENFLLHLRQAGCRHIGLSPDAVTEEGLLNLKKGVTWQDIQECLRLGRKVGGMAVGFNFFCDYPGMTLKGMLQTLYLYFKIPLVLLGRGGIGLGWIRLEPHTKIFDDAVAEGVIHPGQNMLAESEEELLSLFYISPQRRYMALVFDMVIGSVDRVLKPTAKFFFRLLGRIRRRPSLYDA